MSGTSKVRSTTPRIYPNGFAEEINIADVSSRRFKILSHIPTYLALEEDQCMAIVLKKIPDTLGQVEVIDVEGQPRWIPSDLHYVDEDAALAAIKQTMLLAGIPKSKVDSILEQIDVVYD